MKSLKELQDKNRKLPKIIGPDANRLFKELGSNSYVTFHELGPLDLFDFLLLPNKIKNKIKDARHEPIKQKT